MHLVQSNATACAHIWTASHSYQTSMINDEHSLDHCCLECSPPLCCPGCRPVVDRRLAPAHRDPIMDQLCVEHGNICSYGKSLGIGCSMATLHACHQRTAEHAHVDLCYCSQCEIAVRTLITIMPDRLPRVQQHGGMWRQRCCALHCLFQPVVTRRRCLHRLLEIAGACSPGNTGHSVAGLHFAQSNCNNVKHRTSSGASQSSQACCAAFISWTTPDDSLSGLRCCDGRPPTHVCCSATRGAMHVACCVLS